MTGIPAQWPNRSPRRNALAMPFVMIVRHNAIHHCPHVGVLFNSFDNLFEYNEVFQFALVSNDIRGVEPARRIAKATNTPLVI